MMWWRSSCVKAKRRVLKTESSMSMCFISSESLFVQRGCWQSFPWMVFTSTLGTGADRPNGQTVVHLLMVHLSGSNRKFTKWTRRKNTSNWKLQQLSVSWPHLLCKLCRVIKSDASGRWRSLDRMILSNEKWITVITS